MTLWSGAPLVFANQPGQPPTALEFDRWARTESVFAPANGHLGRSANLDECDSVRLVRDVDERSARWAQSSWTGRLGQR